MHPAALELVFLDSLSCDGFQGLIQLASPRYVLQQKITLIIQGLFLCSDSEQGVCSSSCSVSSVQVLQLVGEFPSSYWYHKWRSCTWVVQTGLWNWTSGCNISSPHEHREEPDIQHGRHQAMWDRFGPLPRSSHTSRHMKGYPSLPCALKLWDRRTNRDRQRAGSCVDPCGQYQVGSAAPWSSLKPGSAVINSAKRANSSV